MNTRFHWVFVGFLLLPGFAAADGADPEEVTGQVLDAAGEPVEGITVAPYWISEEGRWTTRTGKRTDAEGKFLFQARYVSGRLMTLDATQKRGAIVSFDAEAARQPLILKLQPTTLVRSAYTNKGLGYEIEKLYVSFTPRATRMAIAAHRGSPSFGLRLPPGDYDLSVGGVDCQRLSQSVTVAGDMPVLDMGTTDLKPTIIAQHYGKAPPAWTVTEARGVKAKTTLADFKGKWVLLEFWGYW